MEAMRLSLTLSTTDPQELTRAYEVFARAAAGMALEGLQVMIICHKEEELSG
jgi:hypothetical protein